MRWCVAAVMIAGCYQPTATLLCPDDTCVPDGGGDGMPTDANADAAQPSACGEVLFDDTATTILVSFAQSYTTDGATAIYENPNVQGDIREAEVNSSAAGAGIMFTAMPILVLQHPKLAPAGEDLFFLGVPPATTDFAMYRSIKAATKMWNPPTELSVMLPSPHIVDINFVPGVPSLASPRHMVASRSQSDLFFEGIENAQGEWDFGNTTFSFVGLTSMSDPYLSPDGLTLIFIGNEGGSIGVFRATRPNIDFVFDQPQRMFDIAANGNERTPAMNPACDSIYVTSGDDRVRRAQPP